MSRDHKAAYARRNQLAQQRGFHSYAQQRRYPRVPSNPPQLAVLPETARERRNDALAAVRLARSEQISLREAAVRQGVPMSAVTWWAEPALEAPRSAQPKVKRGDRLLRVHPLVVNGELTFIATRGSKAAAQARAAYRAQREFLEGRPGSQQALAHLTGVKINSHTVETDPDILETIARRGEFSDLADIYRAWVS